MNILLIVYDNESHIPWFPQGIAYIAAVLKKHGYNVQIYPQDKEHYPDEHLTRYLDTYPFDVVGVSIVGGYYQYRKLLSISVAINQSKNRPYYIMGGHGPAPEPAYFLKKCTADAVVIGEGEETILELLNAIGNNQLLKQVKGIAFREGDEVTINPRRALIQDIDSIPFPAYEMFSIDFYRLKKGINSAKTDFIMPVLSGRGCSFQCNFCYRLDEGVRLRNPQAIVEEIQFLQHKYRINYIQFGDELLMTSEKRTFALCEAFLEADLKIKWDCNGRLNYAKPDVLKQMKKAGCEYVNYGIESMDNSMLKRMGKVLTTETIIRGIEATLAAGISPVLNIIFGNIGETKEILNKGLDILLKYGNGSQLRTIRPVTPYPGSPLYYYAIEKGLLQGVEDFYENKHINSDLLSVNFTSLSDDEFHEALLDANSRLLRHYYQRQLESVLLEAESLYRKRNIAFRGFRQL